MNNQEIEVKFFVDDLEDIARRIADAGGQFAISRVREVNLRFDKPDRSLTQAMQVLRLRKDFKSRLTFKGPSLGDESVSVRQEIEFEVSSFENAQKFLEALGYEMYLMYEKYRTTYTLSNVIVVLDEMPYGNFVEIEGPDADSIRQVAGDLKLDWEARCTDSYTLLFRQLKESHQLDVRQLSFEDFEGLHFAAEDFGLKPGSLV